MNYTPGAGADWQQTDASQAGFDPERLREATDFALATETTWPRDLGAADNVPGLTDIEPPPWNKVLGPFKPRGGPNGVVIKAGKMVASWGDVERTDMTFSIAKSYFSVLTGIAVGDGLIADIDAPMADTISGELFASDHNKTITWRHLLHQTSEWQGTLFDKPDQVDHFRQVGAGSDNTRKGELRQLQPPGGFWEYNDVRVNLLGLSLLHVFKRPLADVLRERVMEPIGASDTWEWHGYENSWVEIDGQRMQSVPGGTHWGGGIHISSLDHARFGLLVHRDGIWGENRILPEGWCTQLRTPCPIQDNYGFLWWLNTRGSHWQGLPVTSYAAVGAGTNIIWIAPDNDMLVVARWMHNDKVDEILTKFVTALA
jgi:CubicO group peptidase (beta-lactamase class C family)